MAFPDGIPTSGLGPDAHCPLCGQLRLGNPLGVIGPGMPEWDAYMEECQQKTRAQHALALGLAAQQREGEG